MRKLVFDWVKENWFPPMFIVALVLHVISPAFAGIVPPVVDSTARAAAATADGKAVAAQTTANTAVTNAAAAQTTANTASTNASSALSGSAHDSTARAAAATAQARSDSVFQTVNPTAGTYRLLVGNNYEVNNFTTLYYDSATATIQGANISGNAATATSATDSTARADAANALSYAQPAFTSGQLAVQINTSYVHTVAHGLGAKPSMVQLSLLNVTAEAGYSIGDEIQYTGCGPATSLMCGVAVDATNLTVMHSSTSFTINRKDNGTSIGLTAANWKWIVRAWK